MSTTRPDTNISPNFLFTLHRNGSRRIRRCGPVVDSRRTRGPRRQRSRRSPGRTARLPLISILPILILDGPESARRRPRRVHGQRRAQLRRITEVQGHGSWRGRGGRGSGAGVIVLVGALQKGGIMGGCGGRRGSAMREVLEVREERRDRSLYRQLAEC